MTATTPGAVSSTTACASRTWCWTPSANVSATTSSSGCGWCAPHEVVYTDGTKGNRCANSHDPKKWFCLGKLQTDSCIEGYVCTGAPNYKCELSGKPGEGTPDAHACIDGCELDTSFTYHDGSSDTIYGDSAFWRLLIVSLIVALGTRATFRHLDATFPKYFMRTFGADACARGHEGRARWT